MARFSGPKQGLGVWIIALVVTVVLAVAGAVLGAEYNVLSELNLPRIPIGEGALTTGGLIALAAIVLGTLLAAVAGGKAGTHYHRKIDRAGARERIGARRRLLHPTRAGPATTGRPRHPPQEQLRSLMHTDQAIAWRSKTAVDSDGEKIGTIDEIYLDAETSRPEWLAVKTGLFG